MNLTSQGLNFLGLTAKKYNIAETPGNLNAVQAKLQMFTHVSEGYANNNVALENLKSVNAKAYCVIDSEKVEINEKAWDRGGILEGKAPLEEGIASGLYHIEKTEQSPGLEEEKADLEELLSQLKTQFEADAASAGIKAPKEPFSTDSSSKVKKENKIQAGGNFQLFS